MNWMSFHLLYQFVPDVIYIMFIYMVEQLNSDFFNWKNYPDYSAFLSRDIFIVCADFPFENTANKRHGSKRYFLQGMRTKEKADHSKPHSQILS